MSGKKNLLFALIAFVAAFLIQFFIFGYVETWRMWQVFPNYPHFNDLRGLLVWADLYGSGIDPRLYDHPSPSIQTMNYPRIWMYIHHLGLGENCTTAAGMVIIALFLAGLLIGLPRLNHKGVAFIIAAVASPAVLLGIERVNIDLFLFFILSLAVACVSTRPFFAWAAVVLTFELKLYPIFGLLVLLRKKASVFFGLMLAAFAYVFLRAICNMDELALIAATTPRSSYASFGIRIFSQLMESYGPAAALAAQTLSCAVVAATLILSFRALGLSEPDTLGETDTDPRRLDAFRMGAAIYTGTFLIGNNWDYRLLFLIFTIPQLLDWRLHASPIVSRAALAVLAATYLALWHFPITRVLLLLIPFGLKAALILDQVSHYVICSGLIYLFVLSLPRDMVDLIKSVSGQPMSHTAKPSFKETPTEKRLPGLVEGTASPGKRLDMHLRCP